LVVDATISLGDRTETLKKIIEEENLVIPTTIESLLFECIPSYKDEKFKPVLAIAKNRPANIEI
jgi:hypothetical protein